MSYRSRSDDDVEPAYFVLVLVLFILLISMIVLLVSTVVKQHKFDSAFDNESVSFNSSNIKLGESGHPGYTNFDGEIPTLGSTIVQRPRELEVSECKTLELPKGTTSINFASRFPQADLVNVQMPERDSGNLNICVPAGATLKVILWLPK